MESLKFDSKAVSVPPHTGRLWYAYCSIVQLYDALYECMTIVETDALTVYSGATSHNEYQGHREACRCSPCQPRLT